MLGYAEQHLSATTEDDGKELAIWITDREPAKQDLLKSRGYLNDGQETVRCLITPSLFPQLLYPQVSASYPVQKSMVSD